MRATSGSQGFGRIRSTLLKQKPTQLVRLIPVVAPVFSLVLVSATIFTGASLSGSVDVHFSVLGSLEQCRLG